MNLLKDGLSSRRQAQSALHSWPVKILTTIGLIYLFILAITLLGAGFKLGGREFAESIFRATANPIVGLIIGLLTTSVVQSSSTTTSLIVGLVGSGVLPFHAAVPMVMGANIGTTITNLIVSLGHISRSLEFKRAFAGSVVHDFFNLCAVTVLLPLEMAFGIISKSALVASQLFAGFGGAKFSSPLKAITKPVANGIVDLTADSAWIVIVLALILLFLALRYIVKVLRSLVLSKVERFFQRFVFRNAALGFLLGAILTTLVQSSSITTSLVVPLIGAGVLTMVQVFPYMLGANIGTTITAFLASFVTGSPEAVSVAFAHLLFNIYGIGLFWPLKKIPITLAEIMSNLTMKSKLVPIGFIIFTYFLVPGVLLLIMG